MTHDRQKIASDGLSTDYYKLPETRKLHEIIKFKNMTMGIAYIFESCYTLLDIDKSDIIITLGNIHHIASQIIENYNKNGNIECELTNWKPNTNVEVPYHAFELRHLISHKAMSKSRGDIFKACYRLGEKLGTDILYDLNKIKFFTEDLIEMYNKNEHL